ncbi:unnamed protein product [Ostreobium quekettii]|uniref:Cupin type-2 domain-containing protein n=1 Tax=Ostreobium quekettii TaxID=121088 RepID=A0A8S1IKH6_9CHLO|nr:unnamed protein product [Ostreobium quekettii]
MKMKRLFVCAALSVIGYQVLAQEAARPDAEAAGTKFTIDNCVNTFNEEGAIKTDAGYQYWFADKKFLDGRTLKLSVVKPHQATHAPHTHAEDEFFFILEGEAEFHLNGRTKTGGPLTSFYCPPHSHHGLRNIGDTEMKYLVVTSLKAWLRIKSVNACSLDHSLVIRYEASSATSFHSEELSCPSAALRASITPANFSSKSACFPGIT